MPAISWVTFKERVVAKNSPRFNDVTNRPLRQILQLSNFDPDDPNFIGLQHFPDGLYTDSITEQNAGAGVEVHSPVQFDAAVTFLSTIEFDEAVTFDSTIHVIGNAAIDGNETIGGDLHVTGTVTGTFGNITIGRLNLDTQPQIANTWFGYTLHTIAGNSWLEYDLGVNILSYFVADAFEVVQCLMKAGGDVSTHVLWAIYNNIGLFVNNGMEFEGNVVMKQHTAFGTRFVVPFDGIYQAGFQLAGVSDIGLSEKLIDRGETGWTAGTGTQTKGGLDTSTATTAQVAAVVNALVNALMNHHKLIRT